MGMRTGTSYYEKNERLMRRRAVQSFAAGTALAVDVALEIAAVEQLSQHKLLEGGDGTGVKAQLLLKKCDQTTGEHHVARAHGGGDGLGKGVEIDHAVLMREGEKRFHRLRGDGELGAVVRFDDETIRFFRPADVFVTLGGGGSDAAGKAAVGRGVQNVRARTGERIAVNAVTNQRQFFVRYAFCVIDLPQLVVSRRFDGVDFVPAEQIDDEAIEIFRTGADDNLFRVHLNAAVARKVLPDCVAQLDQPRVGGALQ